MSQVPNLPNRLMSGPAPASLQSSAMARPEQSLNSAGPVPEGVIARAAFSVRQPPGMAMFNPMMLSTAIAIAFRSPPLPRRGLSPRPHPIALAAVGQETNVGKLMARGFRPAWVGTLALLFSAGFSLTLIKLME